MSDPDRLRRDTRLRIGQPDRAAAQRQIRARQPPPAPAWRRQFASEDRYQRFLQAQRMDPVLLLENWPHKDAQDEALLEALRAGPRVSALTQRAR